MPQFDTHFFSSLIFWEIVSFGILLWVLYKYAFPPILETLETRERRIKESLEEAERKLREYEAKLSAAGREAEAVLARAQDRAQSLMEENEQRLLAEAERIK